MVGDARKLALLERIARLKAERELKKFAAFNTHMVKAREKVETCQAALRQSYESDALTVAEARIANAQAARSAYELNRAFADIQRMTPRFERARAAAAREFGRAEVLLELSQKARRTRDP